MTRLWPETRRTSVPDWHSLVRSRGEPVNRHKSGQQSAPSDVLTDRFAVHRDTIGTRGRRFSTFLCDKTLWHTRVFVGAGDRDRTGMTRRLVRAVAVSVP